MRRFLLLLLLGLLASCSPPSFVAHRYDNFTAYYNTFYNAKEAFESGAQTIESPNAPIDRTRYLPVFILPERAAYAQDFEQAIQKSADVLREHPNSKWVDDALMLIGQSYFYRRNYVGAAQKFREIIALGGGLEGAARFWLARTLIASGEYEAAAEHLRASLDGEATYGRWTDMMHLVRGELYVRQGRWEEAVTALGRGLQGDPEEEAAVRAVFLLGQVRETMGAYNAAARAFEYVNEAYQPRYELSYAARVSALRVRGLYGNTEEALARLRRMERDDKNYEKRAELMLLRAQLYQAQDKPDLAQWTLRTLLYVEDAASNDVRGRAHYALGRLHETVYDDFSRAAAHYDTAATTLDRGASPNGNVPDVAPAAITDSEARADLFSRLAEKSEAVSRLDSLLYLGSLDDAAFQRFIATLRRRRAAEQAQRRRVAERRQAAQRFREGQSRIRRAENRAQDVTTTSSSATSFLFHRNPVRAQEARRNFERRWGRRPLVPNWRRREAIAAQREVRPASDPVPSDSLANPLAADTAVVDPAGGHLVDVSDVPRDSASRARMRAQRAVARYELASTLFLAAGRPDSAAAWYRRVVEEDAEHPVARRALYALAEVHRAQGDTTVARRIYRRIVEEYPGSSFAERARERLNLAAPSIETDSLAQAEAAYARAYATWQRGDDTEALQQLIDVAARFASSSVAPKALWAAGTLVMRRSAGQRLGLDTQLPPVFGRVLRPADTTEALRASRSAPISSMETRRLTLRDLMTFLVAQYPASPHAQRAQRLLDAANTEAADVDSLAAGTDSLSTDTTRTHPDAPVDTLAADSTLADAAHANLPAASDTARASRPTPPPTDTARAAESSEPTARRSRPHTGPWIIVLAVRSSQTEAATARKIYQERFRDEDLTVHLFETVVDGTPRYRVAIGTYQDERAARAAMQQLAEHLPEGARVLRVR